VGHRASEENGVTDIDDRPPRPSIAEIREVCQPPAVTGRRNSEHWVADVYLRRWSPYLTRLLLRTPITANGVTWLMVATGASAAFALLIPGLAGATLAAILGQLQMLWDCSDGEVARWRRTTSPKGVFIDRVGHYTAEGLIPIALGLRAAGFPEAGWLDSPWPLIGALISVMVLYNKALNDMVHVSRAYNGLPRLEEKASVAQPHRSGLRRLRSMARFFPFHRAYHSVELTLLAFAAAIGDAIVGDLAVTRLLVAFLAVFGVLTIVGHLASILSSSRLR
jgi:phosphatidylglycerophosphate synthase